MTNTTQLQLLGETCTYKSVLPFKRAYLIMKGAAVAQWLRYCATNQKVAGSIPDCVIGNFH
jgi:hypothetical protein